MNRISLAVLLGLTAFLNTACQIGYYAHTGYNQTKMLWSRTPVEKALNDSRLSPEQKAKLRAAQEARAFAEAELGLTSNGNYETYVHLDRDAVTYVVQAAYANELKSYKWKFPIVGAVPYKGYFSREKAEKEAARFSKDEYDVWIRGVRAYSTLGWFRDPITSPMLSYQEHDLVETIIHELTHTTLYLKNAAEFNERLATFVGVEGAKKMYLRKEGAGSETVRRINLENEDLQAFSAFISEELKKLREWYKIKKPEEIRLQKEDRMKEIQLSFVQNLKPKMKTDLFNNFAQQKLNNAILMSLETYVSDLKPFQELYDKTGQDLPRFIREVKKLEKSKNPEADLKSLL